MGQKHTKKKNLKWGRQTHKHKIAINLDGVAISTVFVAAAAVFGQIVAAAERMNI